MFVGSTRREDTGNTSTERSLQILRGTTWQAKYLPPYRQESISHSNILKWSNASPNTLGCSN